jgi:protein-disulfide isomerase
MLASPLRLAIAGAIVALTTLLNVAAADAPPPKGAEQARVEQAIQAYANKLEADQEKARDQLIANRTTALLRDPGTPVIGNPQGDVAVIEFFDYTCPYCKAVEPRLEKLLKDDKGVKLILKEFPILTPESLVAAKAALASVKQGKYEQFHNALIGFKGRLQNSVIFDTAKDVGLDVGRLRKDMEAPEITDEIIANFNLARALRIFETPGFIVGGHMLTGLSAEIEFPKVVAAARANKG